MADAWGGSWGASSAWGGSWGAGITPPVADDTPTQGMGPGWNLFHPPSTRRRKRDTLEDELREIVFGVEDAPAEQQAEAATEAREVAKKIIEAAPVADSASLSMLADALKRIQSIEADVAAYMQAVRAALDQARLAEEDDMAAFMLMARLV